MNLPLVFGCIILTILATAKLTYQKSVLETSKENAPLRRRQPRATKDGSITLLVDRWTIVGYIVDPPTVFPENNYLVPPSPCAKGQKLCVGANDNSTAFETNGLPTNVQENEDEVNNSDSAESTSPICNSTTQISFPKIVKSEDGTFKYLVNPGQYKQGFRIETCTADGRGCRAPGGVGYGYTSQCLQKYVRRDLLVFNTNSSSGFTTDTIEFPSGCSCEIVLDPNLFRVPDES